jgi:ubiquitin
MAHKKHTEKEHKSESQHVIALRRLKEMQAHFEKCRKKNGAAIEYPFGVYIRYKDSHGKERSVPFIDGDRQMNEVHAFTKDGDPIYEDGHPLCGYDGLEKTLARARAENWEVEVYFTKRKVRPAEIFPMTLDMVKEVGDRETNIYELEGIVMGACENEQWAVHFIEDPEKHFGDKGPIERINGTIEYFGKIKWVPKKEKYFGIKFQYEDKDGMIQERIFIDGDKQMKDVYGYAVTEGTISFEHKPELKGYAAMEKVLNSAKQRGQKIILSVISDENELEGIVIGDHDGFIFGEAGMIHGDGTVFIEDAKDFGVNKKGEAKMPDNLIGKVVEVGYYKEEDVYKK